MSFVQGDGHTLSGTTVATGTGGVALGLYNVDDQVDVLVMAKSATTHTCTISDNLGNFFVANFDHSLTASASREFYRFRAHIVNVGGSPIITATYGATAELAIAVTCLSGILPSNPLSSGNWINHYQTAASIGASPATNSQASGNSPSLLLQPALAAAWGYCDGNTAAPTAGTAYTAVGTPLWGALGSPCLQYETQVITSYTTVNGQFTPVPSQDAYTFLAVFNELAALPPTPNPFYSQKTTLYFI
jgi:hypothetical protein